MRGPARDDTTTLTTTTTTPAERRRARRVHYRRVRVHISPSMLYIICTDADAAHGHGAEVEAHRNWRPSGATSGRGDCLIFRARVVT